ncbi:hypothetical protein MW887_011224 [Aspergillus wentii]|nr:hypothetical protein MW887_011224 [Aspergillus wentii]
MDVTADSFSYHLPRILDDLAACCFVSLDFEFSGIATNTVGPSRGSQSLQARYAETKRAADKYQILQIGLTVCHEDTETATYTLKPYNLYLSPIIDQKLEVERDGTFQSGAVEFLLANKFSMDSYYRNGVSYLSREEEDLAIAKAKERHDRTVVCSTLDVKETEHESIKFLKATRRLVDDWLARDKTREGYLNIPPPSRANESHESKLFPATLNRFQKRLVHQLIEAEYPSLVTIGKPTFVQIINYNEEREKAIKEQQLKRTQERIWRQTGFRWIAEALAGGNLSNLDAGYFTGILSSSIAVKSKHSLREFSEKLKEALKSHRPVLVGHNLFTDLVYFCRCFLGPLPDRVEDFQAMAHELFPMLMDTKYMATHDCGSINPRSSLQEINDSLVQQATPRINVHHQHGKYKTQRIDHEAGYDSFLTAQVFIKLSAQLRDGGTSRLPGPAPIERGISTASKTPTDQKPERSSHSQHLKDLNTRFDLIQVEEDLDALESVPPNAEVSLDSSPEVTRRVNAGELIPRRGAQFWQVYGNQLRVFGTEERVRTIGTTSVAETI